MILDLATADTVSDPVDMVTVNNGALQANEALVSLQVLTGIGRDQFFINEDSFLNFLGTASPLVIDAGVGETDKVTFNSGSLCFLVQIEELSLTYHRCVIDRRWCVSRVGLIRRFSGW